MKKRMPTIFLRKYPCTLAQLESNNNFNYLAAEYPQRGRPVTNLAKLFVRDGEGGRGGWSLEQIKVAPLIARDNVTREDNTN